MQTLLFIGGTNHERWQVMIGCMSAVLVLAVMTIGIFIMLRLLTFERMVSAIVRVFLLILAALVGVCFLRQLLVTVILPVFDILKSFFIWLAFACVAGLGFLLLIRITIGLFQKSQRKRSHREERES